MKEDREYKIIAIIALIIAIASLSTAYAAYSQTLKISGSGMIEKGKWNIYFDNLQEPVVKGGAINQSSPAIIEKSTKISGFSAKLIAPGSSISYLFDIKNDGESDAVLSNYILGKLSCKSTDTNVVSEETANAVCEDLSYTLSYYDENGNQLMIKEKDTLNKNSIKKLILKLSWKESSNIVVKDNINVIIGDTILTYSQK